MKYLKYDVFYDQCGRQWNERIQVTARDSNSGMRKALNIATKSLPKFTTIIRIDSCISNQWLGDVGVERNV